MTRLPLPWSNGTFWRTRLGTRHTLPIRLKFPKVVWRLYWISRRWWWNLPEWKFLTVRCLTRPRLLQNQWRWCTVCAVKRWKKRVPTNCLLITRFSRRRRTCWSPVLPRKESSWFTGITTRLNLPRMYSVLLSSTRLLTERFVITRLLLIVYTRTVHCCRLWLTWWASCCWLLRENGVLTWLWEQRNVSVSRCLTVDLMLLTWQRERNTNVTSWDVLSVWRLMHREIMHCVWLCRPVNNISNGRKLLPISVLPRLWMPRWPDSMPLITVGKDWKELPVTFILQPWFWPKKSRN